MIDSKDILSLLSIPSEDVSYTSIIDDKNNIYFVEIELKDNRPNCPFCFSNKVIIKDYYTTKIKNSILQKKKLYVTVKNRRYKCKNCNRTFKQNYSLSNKNETISINIKEIVKKMLMDRISMQYIAKELDISKQTVINILDSMRTPNRLNWPTVLCIDEFHFSNANHEAGKYPCVLSNPFDSEIIDIIESRRKGYLIDYFDNISYQEREKVEYFISDMNETYRFVHRRYFKHSVYIVDHFHIVKLFTEAIQKLRIKIMKKHSKDSKAYKFLKENWKLFLKNRFDLKDSVRTNKRTGVVHYILDDVDMVLKEYPDLKLVYWTKEEFCSTMLKLHGYEETKEIIDFFIDQYCNSSIEEIRSIGKTFKHWYKEIINAYAKNLYGVVLTNAMAESNNNYIQTLINIGYGFTNFPRLRKRILYMSSNKKSNQF